MYPKMPAAGITVKYVGLIFSVYILHRVVEGHFRDTREVCVAASSNFECMSQEILSWSFFC